MGAGLSCLLLVAAMAARPFSEDRELLDRRLETLRRILPDAPNPVADAGLIGEMARGARLDNVEAAARPPLESGAKGDVPVEVSGSGRFADLDRFFRQVALSPRLIDVESLVLTAAPGSTLTFHALVHLPYRPSRAPLPAVPEGVRVPTDVPRPQAAAYARDQALAVAKAQAIDERRRAQRNPRLFLSELSSVVRDRPVALTRASLAEEFLVSGLTVGEASMRALQTRFERGFFRVAEVLVARQGACHRFEVRGKSPVVGLEAEIPLPTEDPFRQDEAACRADRDTERGPTLRGPRPRRGVSGGPLSVRLRETDLADVFLVLHRLTGQAFLVDHDVRGRVSLDFDGTELEPVLLALQQKAGLRVSPPGPLRRVSRAGPKPPVSPLKAARSDGARMTVAVKRVLVRDLLPVLAESDPALGASAPTAALGRVSLFAKDFAAADLQQAVLDSVGLYPRASAEGEEPPRPVAATSDPGRLVLRPQDLTVLEFQLAGVAASASGWTAFAYAPGGALFSFRVGDHLADATVAGIESTDVLLQTDEGPWRLPLPDAPP